MPDVDLRKCGLPPSRDCSDRRSPRWQLPPRFAARLLIHSDPVGQRLELFLPGPVS
jgi:hypothetical protein